MYRKIYTYSHSIKKDDKDIFDIINKFFKEDNVKEICNLPKKFGDGYFSTVNPNKDILISMVNIRFNNNISFIELSKSKCFLLYFCISESFYWQDVNTHKDFNLCTNELFIHRNYNFTSNNILEANKRYIGIGIALNEQKFKSLIEEYFCKHTISDLFNKNLNKIEISFKIKLILKDILECKYTNTLKNVYIEGKVLELLATLANEIKEKNVLKRDRYISRSDLKSLNSIKNIIDENYVNPLTISELSKMALISETKLKTNFKSIFGKTIYEYVINKRMEIAKNLLDERRIKVKEAAVLVGYSNIGYFSKTFKEKYGFSPSEYIKLR